jgi:hypothetical protein
VLCGNLAILSLLRPIWPDRGFCSDFKVKGNFLGAPASIDNKSGARWMEYG